MGKSDIRALSIIKLFNKYSITRLDYLPLLLIILIPAGFWVAALSTTINVPYQGFDSEYPYFLNSLKPFKGGGYTYIDHPGTPLEVIGTVVLAATYPFVKNHPSGFVQYHIENPAVFLVIVRLILLVLHVFTAISFYFTVISSNRVFSRPFAVSIVLLYYIIHTASFYSLTYWNHNSFNYSLGTLYLLLLYNLLVLKRGASLSLKSISYLGCFAGALVSIMIYMAAWVVGALVMLGVLSFLTQMPWKTTIRRLFLFSVSSLSGFMIAVLPIWAELPRFFGWIGRIIVHQGRYGTGERGFTSLPALMENFVKITLDQPALFLMLVISFTLCFVVVANKAYIPADNHGKFSFLLGLMTLVVILFFLIVKHPGTHNDYLLSIAACVPVLLFAALDVMDFRPSTQSWLVKLFAIIILGGLLPGMGYSWYTFRDRINNIVAAERLISAFIDDYAISNSCNREDLKIVWGYGVYENCSNMARANNNHVRAFYAEINNLCPMQEYFINDSLIFGRRAISDKGEIHNFSSLDWDILITRGSNYNNLQPHVIGHIEKTELEGVKTGLPGYKVIHSIIILTKRP